MNSKNLIKTKNKVLILLATFNGEKFLAKQLQSIIDQKNIEIELLISDDFSSDNTFQIINKFKKKYKKKIKILKNTKKFGSAGKNFFNLIKNTSAKNYDYVAFSDQDDIWFKNKIITAIKIIENNYAAALSSDIIAFYGNNKRKLIKKSFSQKKYDHWFQGPGPGCSQVISADAFRLFQFFVIKNFKFINRIKYHDWLIYAFFRYNNFKWIISAKPRILYRQHDSNELGANHGLYAKISRLNKIFKKNYKNEVVDIFNLVTKKNFFKFIKSENLLLKPLNLRRKKLDSLFIWCLILINYFKN